LWKIPIDIKNLFFIIKKKKNRNIVSLNSLIKKAITWITLPTCFFLLFKTQSRLLNLTSECLNLIILFSFSFLFAIKERKVGVGQALVTNDAGRKRRKYKYWNPNIWKETINGYKSYNLTQENWDDFFIYWDMIPRLRHFQVYYIKYDMISIKLIYINNFDWFCLAEIYWS